MALKSFAWTTRLPRTQRSLDEVRAEIEPIVAAQKNQKIAEQLAHTVESQAKSGGLEKAAASNGLQVQESGYFTRNDVAARNRLLAAVRRCRIRHEGQRRSGIGSAGARLCRCPGYRGKTAGDAYLRAGEGSSRDRVEAAESASACWGRRLQELSDKAHASHNLREAAKAVGATVKTSDLVAPDGQVPDLGQVASSAPQVFEMKPGDISQAINLGQKGVVVALLEKQEPTDAEFDAMKDQIKASLLERKRSEAEEVFIVSLRDRLEKQGSIIVDKKKLEALSQPQGVAEPNFARGEG